VTSIIGTHIDLHETSKNAVISLFAWSDLLAAAWTTETTLMSEIDPPALTAKTNNFDSATVHFPITRLELSRDHNQQPKPHKTATLPQKLSTTEEQTIF